MNRSVPNDSIARYISCTTDARCLQSSRNTFFHENLHVRALPRQLQSRGPREWEFRLEHISDSGLPNMKIQAYLMAAAINLKRLAAAFVALLLLLIVLPRCAVVLHRNAPVSEAKA